MILGGNSRWWRSMHGNSSMLAQQILCVPPLRSVTQIYARKNLWTFYVDHHVTFKRSKLTQVRALETDTSKKQQQQQQTVSSKYIKSCFAVLTNYCEKYKSCKLEEIKIKKIKHLQSYKKQNSFIQNSQSDWMRFTFRLLTNCKPATGWMKQSWKGFRLPCTCVAADLWHKENVVEKLL